MFLATAKQKKNQAQLQRYWQIQPPHSPRAIPEKLLKLPLTCCSISSKFNSTQTNPLQCASKQYVGLPFVLCTSPLQTNDQQPTSSNDMLHKTPLRRGGFKVHMTADAIPGRIQTTEGNNASAILHLSMLNSSSDVEGDLQTETKMYIAQSGSAVNAPSMFWVRRCESWVNYDNAYQLKWY